MSDKIVATAGKVGPHRESHEPRLKAHDFLIDGVVPVKGFLEWNGTAGIGERWGMLGNDVFGDCGPAATSHNNMAKAGNPAIGGDLGRPKFNGVEGTYFAYGIAQGEPGPQPDQGVDNATWLAFLYKEGIIYGYGEVDDDEFDWFAQLFDGGIVGQGLDGTIASNDFNASPRIPWDTMDMSDGHDTLTIITHTDGSGALVTWGAVQPYTAAYRQTNWQDRWVIFDTDDPNVDHAKLQAALQAIHGTVTPITASPVVTESFLEEILDKVRSEFKGIEASKTFEDAEKRAKELEQGLHKAMGLALSRESEQLILQVLQQIVKAYIHI
jgi:hypothetical protein